jgi:hypothetical protein
MSDCLVSRGLRVRFLPPAPTAFQHPSRKLRVITNHTGWALGRGTPLTPHARLLKRGHGPGRRRADASHASCAAVPGPPNALLAQWKSAGLRTRMRAFDSPRGLQLPCLARRTQAALLKRPDQVRLLGGAPSKSRSFSSQDACVPCRRQGCKSPPRPQRRGMDGREAYGGGLLNRRGHDVLRWFESSSILHQQSHPDRQSRVIG